MPIKSEDLVRVTFDPEVDTWTPDYAREWKQKIKDVMKLVPPTHKMGGWFKFSYNMHVKYLRKVLVTSKLMGLKVSVERYDPNAENVFKPCDSREVEILCGLKYDSSSSA